MANAARTTRRGALLTVVPTALALLLCSASTPRCLAQAATSPAAAATPGAATPKAKPPAAKHGDAHGPAGHAHETGRATATHRFDDVKKWVGVFDDPARDAWQKPAELVKALGLEPGQRVADLGAGTGYFERYLADAVGPSGAVFAADVEPALVGHIRDRADSERTPNVVPVVCSLDHARLPPGIDHVLIVDTFHHLDRRPEYFARLRRSLAPRARITIVDFEKRPLPVGPPPEHKIAREEVIAEMIAMGFEHERTIADLLPHQYALVFRARE